ncbi:Circadian clock protein kinase KaiC [uncultured archaeon]|nr:Circadian clock protein kinase KaiC [uncultured archaeon]
MADRSEFFRKDRISTGIGELDVVLEGGYQNPGTVMILGPSGQEKLAFAFHFASAGIREGEKVAYVAMDLSPEEIEGKAAALGMNFKSHTNKELVFIDAYSQTIGARETTRKDIMVPGPSALNDLSLALNDAMSDGPGRRIRVVFHSLSTLSLYSQPDTVIKFLQVIQGRLKGANATSIWLVDEGMHDKKFITSLESLADQVLTLSDKGGAHELSIPNIPIPLSVRTGAAGLEIL